VEEVRLAAVVVARDEAPRIEGTLAALDPALAPWPGAGRLVVDCGSGDPTAELAAARGWPVARLDPAGAVTAAAGRELARGRLDADFLLYVDGDVRVDAGFPAAAVALLQGDRGLFGVGGELRFDEGRGEPPAPPPSGPRPVPLLPALAVYRAAALEAVGGFVPWLESEEDADLGLRLRRAGGRLVRIGPGGVHRSGPRGGLDETFRRYRAGLYFGQGRVVRLRWGGPLAAATLARQWLYLAVILLWLGAAAGVWVWPPAAALPLLLVLAGAAVAARKGSARAAAVSLVTWHVMAWGLLVGLARKPRAREARLKAGPEASR